VRLIRVKWPRTPEAAAIWERLRQQAPTESLFLTPEWLETWSRTLGSGRAVLLAVADSDTVRALVPVQQVALGGGLTALRPLGLGVSDYLDLLLPPDPALRRACLGVLLDGLIQRAGAWDALDLRGLPAESPTVTDLMAVATERGLRCASLPGYARPGLDIRNGWQAYLKTRPGRFRYNLRSRLRRLRELGEVRFRTVSHAEEVGPALASLVSLHARRWEGQHTSTTFSSSEAARRFYAEACERYQGRGLLDLTLLEVGGRAVAGSVGFVDRGTFYYYLPAWDPGLATFAPSSLLLAHLVERACDAGLQRFDFMLGEEAYKASWATDQRTTVNLVVAAPTMRGQAAFAGLVGWQRARNRARSSEWLQHARRYWLGRAKSMVGLRGTLTPTSPRGRGAKPPLPLGEGWGEGL
jgi:CelD/BcsL family acetyltransferase involved in cellulose biosynthesis